MYIYTKTDSRRNRKPIYNPKAMKEITVIVWDLKLRSPVNSYLEKQILSGIFFLVVRFKDRLQCYICPNGRSLISSWWWKRRSNILTKLCLLKVLFLLFALSAKQILSHTDFHG